MAGGPRPDSAPPRGGIGRWGGPALLVASLLLLAALSPRVIPYNMDEFVHYQPLGCLAHPLTREYNTERERCGQYSLRLPFTGTFLPLRSYLYIGSLPVLPFYPFWKILGDPVAVRIQGVVFFLLSALLGARLCALRVSSVLWASLVFPVYPFSFLVDTGPVGLCLLLLLLLLLAARRAGPERGLAGIAFGVLAGLLAFLGILCKPIFAWCLPAVAAFTLGEARRAGGTWKSRAAPLLGALAGFLPPLLALGFSRDVDGDRYYELVRLGGVSPGLESLRGVGRRMAGFLLNGADVVPRTLELHRSAADLLPAFLALGLLAWSFRSATETRAGVRRFALLGLLTLGVTLLTGSAFWPHHFAFTFLFLALALAAALEGLARANPRARTFALALLLGYWALLAWRLPRAAESPDANRSKDRLLAFIRAQGLDRRTVQVHTSWGTFYISHLFGDPAEVVLFFRFREWTEAPPERLQRVRLIAEGLGRGVLVLTSRPERSTDTPVVDAALGPPLAQYPFENWEAIEYLR